MRCAVVEARIRLVSFLFTFDAKNIYDWNDETLESQMKDDVNQCSTF